MTADVREAVRVLIDQRVRQIVSETPMRYCVACGCEVDGFSPGCKRCAERHHTRRRRQTDPVYRDRQNAAHRQRRKAKREATV